MARRSANSPAPLAVRVPPELVPAFEKAQRHVERCFADRIEDPVHGIIELGGDRYILVRAASMSTEFWGLVTRLYRDRGEAEAHDVASGFLFDIAHSLGKADARNFHQRMGVTDPIEKLSAGPIHFAYSGWALVEIHPESRPSPDQDYFLVYDHPYSFEADSWLQSGVKAHGPVCVMNAGYSSGWCEESFGLPLVAVELECRAAGDAHCRFVMAPPEEIRQRIAEYDPSRSPTGPRGVAEIPEFFKRKRLEEELQRHQEKLEARVKDRTRELQAANARLREEIERRQLAEQHLAHAAKMEAVGQLAGGLAHDFNNLLTAVTGGVRLALRTATNEAAPMLRHALEATRRANDLTRHLLTLAQSSTGTMAPVDLNELIASTVRFLRSAVHGSVVLEIGDTLAEPVAWVDPTELEHALVNLAFNGRDAMPEGGTLRFGATLVEEGGQRLVCLAVEDTGEGVDQTIIEQIFEPLFTTRRGDGGTGFGLARVSACARAHGGRVSVESRPGVGSTFRIYLPYHAGERPLTVDGGLSELPRGEETLLIVDDQPSVLKIAQGILRSCGYQAIVAADGPAAIAAWQANPQVALVVTDLHLPGSDGRGVLRQLRARGAQLPVILMSGQLSTRNPMELLRAGFAEFLPKPFSPAQLAMAVRRVLDARSRQIQDR